MFASGEVKESLIHVVRPEKFFFYEFLVNLHEIFDFCARKNCFLVANFLLGYSRYRGVTIFETREPGVFYGLKSMTVIALMP